MARSSSTWKPGIPSPNPTGKMTLGERVAARTIAEAFRELADPVDIGRSLLAIYSGIDPFAKVDDSNPDKLPVQGAVPIDMTHRMAALKMYLEYGYGKPLQGVVIDAQVRQQTTLREERHTVVELRELSRSSPEAREALRTIARAVLGQRTSVQVEAGNAQPLGGVADPLVRAAPELAPELARAPEGEVRGAAEGAPDDGGVAVSKPEALEEDELLAEEDGPVGEGVALLDLHGDMIAELDAAVNGKEKKPAVRLPGDVL